MGVVGYCTHVELKRKQKNGYRWKLKADTLKRIRNPGLKTVLEVTWTETEAPPTEGKAPPLKPCQPTEAEDEPSLKRLKLSESATDEAQMPPLN